jgi:hypothetical protein
MLGLVRNQLKVFLLIISDLKYDIVEYLANQWHTDVDDKGSVVLPSVDHEPKGVVSIAP